MIVRPEAQIEAGAIRCANALFARGVAAGAAVAVSLPEGDACAAALRACDVRRFVPVRLDPGADADALRTALGRAAAVALVHERASAARVASVRRALPALRVVLSVDDGSGADLTNAGSEDFESALAGASPTHA